MKTSHETEQDLGKIAITSKFIWGALTFSQLMYLVVLTASANSLRSRAEDAAHLDRATFAMIAATMALVSLALRAKLLSAERLTSAVASESEPTRARIRIVRLAFVPNILNWALNESVSILGFVLAFVNREPALFYPHLAAGILLNLLMFPNERALFRKAGLES